MAIKSWSSIGKTETTEQKQTVERVKLETGKPFKFAIVGDPCEFHQHMMKGNYEGKVAWRSLRCDGDCPICRAGKYKSTRRFAFNVLDLQDNTVKVLEVGKTVIDQIQMVATLGMNPTELTWVLTKNGTGTNTVYSAMQLGKHLISDEVFETMTVDKYDLDKIFKEHTEEEMKTTLGKIGISWEEVTTEETFNVPTLKQAREMAIPFGKNKGRKLGEVFDEDRSSNGWVNWAGFNLKPSEFRNACRVVLSEEGGLYFEDLQTP